MTDNRDFMEPHFDLNGKTVLVTGGTGSFGRRFIRTVLQRYQPNRLIVFSRDELKQYEMQQEFNEVDYPCMRYFIGDVRDQGRLEAAMRDVNYVIHAAALKQVPAAEYNPFECVKTNIHGAENVVNSAIHTGVERVIALSTDKAVSPANLYGATKLASDKIFVAANAFAGNLPTRFAVVRYGNVAGSRGSVIPFFRKLVEQGVDKLPITDPEMTRFLITLQQGVNFVLSSLAMMRGGEVFVPRIPSVRIMDLAEAIAPGLPTDIIGIRPGEKLHERMISPDDAPNTVELPDRFVIEPAFVYRGDQLLEREQEAKPVPDRFDYSSELNDEWLTGDSLNQFLKASD